MEHYSAIIIALVTGAFIFGLPFRSILQLITFLAYHHHWLWRSPLFGWQNLFLLFIYIFIVWHSSLTPRRRNNYIIVLFWLTPLFLWILHLQGPQLRPFLVYLLSSQWHNELIIRVIFNRPYYPQILCGTNFRAEEVQEN